MHTGSGLSGKGVVGAATAAAVAADVLRDDDDDDEMMVDMGVDDDEDHDGDPDDLEDEDDDDMYDDMINGPSPGVHGHFRTRRSIPGRSHHMVPEIDDEMMSDEDPVERGMHNSDRHNLMRYQDSVGVRRSSQNLRRTNSRNQIGRAHV